jgi:hypothetical protein
MRRNLWKSGPQSDLQDAGRKLCGKRTGIAAQFLIEASKLLALPQSMETMRQSIDTVRESIDTLR